MNPGLFKTFFEGISCNGLFMSFALITDDDLMNFGLGSAAKGVGKIFLLMQKL